MTETQNAPEGCPSSSLTTNEAKGPRFLIAGYGTAGIDAMTLLANTELTTAKTTQPNGKTFIKLQEPAAATRIPDALPAIDVAFILGSDADVTTPASALMLARQCKEAGIPCVCALIITEPTRQTDEATTTLCALSSNVFLFFAEKLESEFSCFALKEAISCLIDPLLGKGLVAVDLDDLKTILQLGHRLHFGMGYGKGHDRAQIAAQTALQQLPQIPQATALFCNITHGPDFDLDEYSAISICLDAATAHDCSLLLCTTFNPGQQGDLHLSICCALPG